MSDAEWDAEDYESVLNTAQTDRWEGEDEEDVKDNWDDEDEEEKPTSQEPVKKKKTLKEKIAEREEAKQKEIETKLEKQRLKEEAKDPGKLREEKERLVKIQQDADLELALEAFGLSEADSKKLGPIELSQPQNKEDFNKFSNLLYEKIIKYKDSEFFLPFIENLFRDLTLEVDAENIKKISTSLTTLYNEKLKATKIQKNKKTANKIMPGQKDEFADFADYM